MKYYAVRVGKEPGIYTDWSEVQPLVSGFKDAIYKSFNTLEDAEDFIIIETFGDGTVFDLFKQLEEIGGHLL